MCQVLGVPTGGYPERRRRPPSARQGRREALAAEIAAIHEEARARHGSPRIHAGLVARGEPRCASTAAKPMRQPGVAAEAGRKSRRTTDSNRGRPVAEDVADREPEPGAPDPVRAADITSIPTRGGWLYPAAVEDLDSRPVVGRSMGERTDSRPVVDAPEMAVSRRPPGEGLVAHSGRGSR